MPLQHRSCGKCGDFRVRHILVSGQSLRAARRDAAGIGGLLSVLAFVFACIVLASPAAKADAAFRAWIETLWPEAQAAGVKRATFDAAFKGVEPDYKLPDLDLPGTPTNDARGQAEFTRPPSEYLNKAYLARLAADGKHLAREAQGDAREDRARYRRRPLLRARNLGPRDRLRHPQGPS